VVYELQIYPNSRHRLPTESKTNQLIPSRTHRESFERPSRYRDKILNIETATQSFNDVTSIWMSDHQHKDVHPLHFGCLKKIEYFEYHNTPCFYRNHTGTVYFTLVVNDFCIYYRTFKMRKSLNENILWLHIGITNHIYK
jgi:hypothetical protein